MLVETTHNFIEGRTAEIISADSLLARAEQLRVEASLKINPQNRSALGQFFTPVNVSHLMMRMSQSSQCETIRVLDAGGGTGMLTAAFVAEACSRRGRLKEIEITVFEIDDKLIFYLKQTLNACRKLCRNFDIKFSAEIVNEDFIYENTPALSNNLFSRERKAFDIALLNPPYGKIKAASETSKALRAAGIEVPNLYAAFP